MTAEANLILEVQQGNLSAFGGIYEQYFTKIYRYAVVRLGNAAEAEDVASEVFLKALESVGSYRPRGVPFVAWLFRIAHNLVVDHHRRRSRRPTTTLEDTLPLTTETPDEIVAFGLDLSDVMDAMSDVTDAQRQVIALRFGADLSIAETAQAMKKKEGAIKALQNSAIQALRRRLALQGHDVAAKGPRS